VFRLFEVIPSYPTLELEVLKVALSSPGGVRADAALTDRFAR
jgi:hypothetical protein